MSNLFKSWKTTVAGILQFLTFSFQQVLTLTDGDVLTNPDFTVWIMSLITLIGLITARDNDVTSEQVLPSRENETARALRVERALHR